MIDRGWNSRGSSSSGGGDRRSVAEGEGGESRRGREDGTAVDQGHVLLLLLQMGGRDEFVVVCLDVMGQRGIPGVTIGVRELEFNFSSELTVESIRGSSGRITDGMVVRD